MTDTPAPAGPGADNCVHLRGRLDRPVELREVPSGDVLVAFSLTVTRPEGERGSDSIECVTARPRVRRSLERAAPATWFEVDGRLRRRFWRGPGGLQSRYSVDVVSLRRVDPPAGAVPTRKQASA